VDTIQNWEQGRRKPNGPARALLQVAKHDPKAVLEALHGKKLDTLGGSPSARDYLTKMAS